MEQPQLSFVREFPGASIDYWSTEEETGNWGQDNQVGRRYADEFITKCKSAEALPTVFPFIVEAIMKKGRCGGIEVGFFNRIGEVIQQVPTVET